MSIERVADRVRKGGHHIPEPLIRRRYRAGITNLLGIYRPVLTSWTLFDNSRPLLYTIAAETNGNLTVLDEVMFAEFMNVSKEPPRQQMQEQPLMPDWMKAVVAMRLALIDVVEEHCRTGHPLIIWRDGKVYHQHPEEARRELEQALQNDPWASGIIPTRG